MTTESFIEFYSRGSYMLNPFHSLTIQDQIGYTTGMPIRFQRGKPRLEVSRSGRGPVFQRSSWLAQSDARPALHSAIDRPPPNRSSARSIASRVFSRPAHCARSVRKVSASSASVAAAEVSALFAAATKCTGVIAKRTARQIAPEHRRARRDDRASKSVGPCGAWCDGRAGEATPKLSERNSCGVPSSGSGLPRMALS